MQVGNDGRIKPTFLRPDIADIACPFLVRAIRVEVPCQKIGGNVELVIAVRGGFELLVSFHSCSVFTHQTTHAAMAQPQTLLLTAFREIPETLSII